MGRTQCIRDFKCEVCGIPGMLQVLSKNYARVRHYIKIDPNTGKSKFVYHRQNIEYVKRILNTIGNDHSGQNTIDLNLNNLSCNNRNVRAGSLARLGHPLDVRKVVGSNPARPTN